MSVKIAVIENSNDYVLILKKVFRRHKWVVKFFSNAESFGKANLLDFDIIAVDFLLPTMKGPDLINTLSKKTDAEMMLLAVASEMFTSPDVHNENIGHVIDKEHPEELVGKIKFAIVEKRLNGYCESESKLMRDFNNNVSEKLGGVK